MKNLVSISLSALLVLVMFSAYANNDRTEKIVSKHRDAVENAAPDDWYTLAFSAQQCLEKKANCKEVANWIDKSLSIKVTPYNLEVKGDYYMINRLNDKALECYLQVFKLEKEKDNNFDGTVLQKKIAKIIDLPTT